MFVKVGTVNEEGEQVDMYIPRKCHASNQLIKAFDHAAVQISIGEINADGTFMGTTKTFCIAGVLRTEAESDHALNHLCIEHGIIRPKTGRKTRKTKMMNATAVKSTKVSSLKKGADSKGRGASAGRRPVTSRGNRNEKEEDKSKKSDGRQRKTQEVDSKRQEGSAKRQDGQSKFQEKELKQSADDSKRQKGDSKRQDQDQQKSQEANRQKSKEAQSKPKEAQSKPKETNQSKGQEVLKSKPQDSDVKRQVAQVSNKQVVTSKESNVVKVSDSNVVSQHKESSSLVTDAVGKVTTVTINKEHIEIHKVIKVSKKRV